MIAAVGIDLGGTKCEVQLFDADWALVGQRRDPTPGDYDAIVALLAEQLRWAEAQAGGPVPMGVGTAGLVDAQGVSLTANLPATGRRLVADVGEAVGRPVPFVNDCRALALSEAVFGAGRGKRRVMSLILGTGVGGGLATDGALLADPMGLGGEFGHIAAPASVIVAHGLPVFRCGCGRVGCYEPYVSGPGLSRLAQALCGEEMTPEEVTGGRARGGAAARVWAVWLELMGELLVALVNAADPDLIVLGGGLSRVNGIDRALAEAMNARQIPGFAGPAIVIAEGGDASGARGAALAAWQEAAHG